MNYNEMTGYTPRPDINPEESKPEIKDPIIGKNPEARL
jgi:hypothetical protein